MLRVGIDARMIRYSGIGTYIRSLLAEYQKLQSVAEFFLFGDPRELEEYKNFEVQRLTVPIYSIGEQLKVPFKIRACPIFHVPHYNAPVFYGGKLVVTIQDIIHLKFPQYLPSGKAYLYARYMLRKVVGKAVTVITTSCHTRSDIIEELKVPAEKIRVIPLGVHERFHQIEDESSLAGFRNKYGLPESLILYVGNLKAHKNLLMLLEAFKLLKMEEKIRETIVVTTGGNPVPKELVRKVFNDGMKGWVKFLPSISDDEMPLLYNCARVFVFPSLYEGFGLPPLEAMACGVPVVASNAASLPEVLGDAAVMCDPEDAGSFKNAIHKLLTDDSGRGELVAAGMKRASSFSWAETARKTIDVYKECL